VGTTTQNKQERNLTLLLKKDLFWLILRIVVLVIIQLLVETTLRMKLLDFLGPEDVQNLVYDVMRKLLLTCYTLFFLSVFKKFAVPILTLTISPAIEKFIENPAAKKKTLSSMERFIRYLGYVIAGIALVSIWAYSSIGLWLVGALGTTIIITLTFVLGLFTSSVLGNILAYWVLNNSSKFNVGDRVQIGDVYGDVVEIGLFFTQIKTIKNEVTNIPNLVVMAREVKNFSAKKDVLIHVPVTLGYNVDKEEAKNLLIKSARETKGIISGEGKEPFVLFTELDKYTVTYEINAYTDNPAALVVTKSNMIDKILTEFKKAHIELLSPTYVALKEKEAKDA